MARVLHAPLRVHPSHATAHGRHVNTVRPLRIGVCLATAPQHDLRCETYGDQRVTEDCFTACALMLACMGAGSHIMAGVRKQRQAAIDAVPKMWVPRHGHVFIRPSYVQELCKQWPSFARTWFVEVPVPGVKVPQMHAWMHPYWGTASGAVVGLLFTLLWFQLRSQSMTVLWFRGRFKSRDRYSESDSDRQLTTSNSGGGSQGDGSGNGNGKPPKRKGGFMRTALAALLKLIAGVVWSGAAARRWAGRAKKWRVLTLLAAFLAEHLPPRYAARAGSATTMAGPRLLRSGPRIAGALPAPGTTSGSARQQTGSTPEASSGSTGSTVSEEEEDMLASSSTAGDLAGPLDGLDEALAFKLQWNPELRQVWSSLPGAPAYTPPAALLRISAPSYVSVDGKLQPAGDVANLPTAGSPVPCTLRHINLLDPEHPKGSLYQLAADFCNVAAEFADATNIPLQAVQVEFDFTEDVADLA